MTKPLFTTVLFIAMQWDSFMNVTPYIIQFGTLALLGALLSGLMATDGDIRGSIRKGSAAVILGTVGPILATMWEVNDRILYVSSFLIGLSIDIIYPYLRKSLSRYAKKATKPD